MCPRWILFDLDGTLTDSGPGIMNAAAYALRSYGIAEDDLARLRRFVGPPLKDSFMTLYGFDAARAEEAIGRYREYFADTGIWENRVYPGVPEALDALHREGATLAVATSKPEVFARRILDRFDLAGYFDAVCGSELDGRRTDKAEVVGWLLEHTGAAADTSVMVGDRCHDIVGAAACGVAAVGVTWGYGSRQELLDAGAAALADTPADLPACCRRLPRPGGSIA